jgi:hypothetical protein
MGRVRESSCIAWSGVRLSGTWDHSVQSRSRSSHQTPRHKRNPSRKSTPAPSRATSGIPKIVAMNSTSSKFTCSRLLSWAIAATATGGVCPKIRGRAGLVCDGDLGPEHTCGKRASQLGECAHSHFRCDGRCGLVWVMGVNPLGVGLAADAAWGWCGLRADPGLLFLRVHRGDCPQVRPIGSMSSSLVSSSCRATCHLWPTGNGAGGVHPRAVVHVEVAILAPSRSRVGSESRSAVAEHGTTATATVTAW